MDNARQLMVILISTIMLSGCSLSETFSNLTQTKEEAAAGQTIEQAARETLRKADLEQKRQEYLLSALLMSPPGYNGVSGLVYAYMSPATNQSVVEVVGYLPQPQHNYNVWLTNESQNRFIALSKLTPDDIETEKYTLTYTSTEDLAEYVYMVIGDEASLSAKPTNPVMAGKLITKP
jgi:ABC-type Fe3+-hydroxamate transport system substrate-binding protein